MGRQARSTLDRPWCSACPAWGEVVVVMSREDGLLNGTTSWIQEGGEKLAAHLALHATRNQVTPGQVTLCHMHRYLEMHFSSVTQRPSSSRLCCSFSLQQTSTTGRRPGFPGPCWFPPSGCSEKTEYVFLSSMRQVLPFSIHKGTQG